MDWAVVTIEQQLVQNFAQTLFEWVHVHVRRTTDISTVPSMTLVVPVRDLISTQIPSSSYRHRCDRHL
jgi:hypothetical protein